MIWFFDWYIMMLRIGIGWLVWILSELFCNLCIMCCNDVYLVFNNMFVLIIGKS